jgi:hypothetical protein
VAAQIVVRHRDIRLDAAGIPVMPCGFPQSLPRPVRGQSQQKASGDRSAPAPLKFAVMLSSA